MKPKSTETVTIDFWNTLVKAETGGVARRKVRINALREVAEDHNRQLTEQDFDTAKKLASEQFDEIWFSEQRTPTTDELVDTILSHLNLSATSEEHDFLVREFEESLWEGPPRLADHAAEVLEELSEQYTVGLISDTMYSPGRVLRSYLDQLGLVEYFDGFVFSDETGFSKPNPRAFSQVLEQSGSRPEDSWHIGDLLKTDIKGAKELGMNAILYSEFTHQSEGNNKDVSVTPDHICYNWVEIRELLCR